MIGRWTSLAFLRSPIGPFEPPCPTHTSPPPQPCPTPCLVGAGSPSAGGLWLGGISRDRGGGPPQMGLHVAGQLGRGLAVHAAQLAQDAVSPRGLEPVVLHRVDAQVCCRGEAFVAELADMVRALAVHLHVVRNVSRAQHLATYVTWHLLLVSYCVRPQSILRSKSCLTFLTFEGPFC